MSTDNKPVYYDGSGILNVPNVSGSSAETIDGRTASAQSLQDKPVYYDGSGVIKQE